MDKKVLILGAGGCAKEVFFVCIACKRKVVGFAEENLGKTKKEMYSLPIFDINGIEKGFKRGEIELVAAIGSPARKRVISKMKEKGFAFVEKLVHPSVIMAANVEIGEGSVICPGTVMESDIKIGQHVLVNMSCTIAHDCMIEDFATISPGCNLAGNVSIGKKSFIGAGTTIIEKKSIGENSIIGAMACVIDNIPSFTLAVGVPAKVKKVLKEGELWNQEF